MKNVLMSRVLFYTLFLLFLTKFNSLVAQEWEPVCEQGICIQPFDNTGTDDVNDVPNAYAEGFRLRTAVNTADNTDYAAWSLNTSTSFLLLHHTNWSVDYEYRVRVFSKSRHAGKFIDFGLTNDTSLDNYVNISSNHPVVNTNTWSGTSEEIISDIFDITDLPSGFVMGDGIGDYHVAILPRGSTVGNFVMIDNYILERRLLPVPPSVINFTTNEASVEEGVVTNICLAIDNPPVSSSVTAEVSLLVTGGASHFNSFVTQQVVFPINSLEDICFEVSPSIIGVGGSYTFTISSISGEDNPTIGEVSNFELTVNVAETTEDCEWAGEDMSVCRGGEGATIGFDPTLVENSECWEDYCVKWMPEQGLDDPFTLNAIASPLETTTYTIHVTDNDGMYYGSDEMVVTVIENAYPSISPQVPYICGDGTADLLASITGGFSNYVLMWSPGNESTPLITVDEPGTYTLMARNTETNCISEATVTVQESNLFVEISAASTEICEGGELEFTTMVFGTEDTDYSYLWSNGHDEESLVVDRAGEYSLTVTDLNTDCEATASIIIDEYEPTVEILGAAFDSENGLDELSVLPDEQVVCPDAAFNLGISGEFTSIVWSGSENVVAEGNGSMAIYTAAPEDESVTITVTVTLEDGCEVTDEVTFNNPALDESAVESFIEELGFYCIDITIHGEATLASSSAQRVLTSICDEEEMEGPVQVRDDAKLNIEIDNEEVSDLRSSAYDYLNYFVEEFGYPSARAYISYEGDACACTDGGNYLQDIREKFETDELAFWFIITGEITEGSPGKLCVLANVPISEEHYPVTEERKDFVAFNLQAAKEDGDTGGLASEADQQVFALYDSNLDNWLGHAKQVGPGEDAVLCNGAIIDQPWIVAPSGIPMRMPTQTALSWIYQYPWSIYAAPGTLAGFTIWVEGDEGDAVPQYFGARLIRPLSNPNLSDPATLLSNQFIGYQRYTTRRDTYFPGVYTSIVATDYTNITTFQAGEPDGETPTSSIELNQCTPRVPVFTENYLIPTETNTLGEGPLYQAQTVVSLYESWVLLEPNTTFGTPLSLPTATITDATFSNVFVTDNDTRASTFTLEHEEENGSLVYSYILALFDETGTLDLRLYNCYSGAYDIQLPAEAIPSALIQTISGHTAGHQYEEQDVEAEEVGLGGVYTMELSESQASALGMNYTPNPDLVGTDVDGFDQVVNYAFAQASDLEIYVQEAQRGLMMGDARIHTQFIISADDDAFFINGDEPLNIDGEAATSNFLTGGMSRTDSEDPLVGAPDMKLFVHHKASGGVVLGLRFAEDFFIDIGTPITYTDENGTSQTINQIPLSQGLKLQNMAFQRWEDALLLKVTTTDLDEGLDGCSLLGDCTVDDGQETRPWWVGKRPFTPEFNAANITGELGAIGADFMKDGEISEAFVKVYYQNQQGPIPYITEGPEAPVAFANKIAAANPLVGFYQLGTFGWSVFTNKQTRQGLVQAFSSPKKLAYAMYKDKKDAYLGDNEENRLWAAGNDVGAIFEFFLSGGATLIGNLDDKIRGLGKKADDSARRISDDLPMNANDAGPDTDYFGQMEGAFRKNDDNPLDGFTPDEINEFWGEFMGKNFVNSPVHARKILANPFLARWWKQLKNSPDGLCPFNFAPAPPSGLVSNDEEGTQRGPCIDFDDFIKKLPDPPSADFYNKLEEIFPDTPEGMEKAGQFIDDAANPAFEATFMAMKGNPRLISAWERLSSKPIWRINDSYLSKVLRYTDYGLEITEESGKLVARQSDGIKVGELDIDPIEDVLNDALKIKGEHSTRHFDPDDAGGAITQKSWNNPSFSQLGVDNIITHLSRFESSSIPEQIANNSHMISRLEQIRNGQITPSPHDKRFYTHELEEYARYQSKGIPDGDLPGPDNIGFHENAHTGSLESYSISENNLPLYNPSVPYPEIVPGL